MSSLAPILVIDDNPAIHQDFRKIFAAGQERKAPSMAEAALFGDADEARSAPGFQFDSAYQGKEGLELVQRALARGSHYAVAFVDVRMPPGWDGIETAARLWQIDPDIQVVLCSAYSDYSWGETLAKLGRSDRLVILKKPFDTIEVLQLASALTEKWRLGREARANVATLERRVAERTRELHVAGERVRASEVQYRLLFDNNPHPMWVYDLETLRFAAVNTAAIEHYDYSREEFLGMTILDIRPPEDVAKVKEDVELHGQGKNLGVWRHCKRDGTLIDVEISSDLIFFNDRPARLVLADDVTAKRQAASALKRLNRVHAVLSGINTLILRVRNRDELFDEACRLAISAGGFRMALIAAVAPGSSQIGVIASAGKDGELLATIRAALLSPEIASTTMLAKAMREKAAVVANDSRNDPRLLFRSGYAEAGVRSVAVLPLIVSGKAVGAMTLYATEADFFHEDELKLLKSLADDVAFAVDHIDTQERLEYHAFYDEVTGLANRRLLLERISQGMRADGATQELSLLLLDLERFRNINDSLGRPAGDALLVQVAKWLTRHFGDAHMLARIGADHFAVVSQASDPGRLIEESMAAMMEYPFKLDDAVFRIGAKVGFARFPEDGDDAETLFKNAEAALKTAKARGARYLPYAPAMNLAVAGKLTLENQLRRALENDEFELRFAPYVSLASGKITAAEACIWWNNPRAGPVPRNTFAAVLEESGLVHEVGRWAMQRAIATQLRWQALGLPAVRISLSVSAPELRHPGLIEEIRRATSIDARASQGLELQIPESLIMEDVKHSVASMQVIREMGLNIAIDDFGAGFSSLSHLAKLPAHRLKIDRSFIAQMTAGPQELALVSTIIKLAHSLKLKVSAQGVENEEQSTLLRLLSCNEMQGPLPGTSVSCDLFEALLLSNAAGTTKGPSL